MRAKKAKQLKRHARTLTVGKSKRETDELYNKLKKIYPKGIPIKYTR